MTLQDIRYGMRVEVELPYEQAVERTVEELGKDGFGILAEIDVSATLKKKLDVDFRPYVILGACNPPLAHRALSAEENIGLLLPCNVIVYAGDDASHSYVAAIDPITQLELTGNDAIAPVAKDVRSRLVKVLERVAAP
ncbi:MAG: DUF302 domain-containing protein [Gemmatimonadales bacterium]|jgi:uncharacterized protein (DUF302 family)